jgi:hypothetical protein
MCNRLASTPTNVDEAVVDVAVNLAPTTSPATESIAYGEVVPIPTLPLEVILILSTTADGFDAFGNKITGTAEQITNTIRSQADKVISDIKNGVQTDINAVKNLMNNAELTFNEKMELMKGYAKLVNPALKEFGNKIKSGVMTGVDAIRKYGKEAIDWVQNNKDAMKAIAISIAKFAVKKGIPLAGEQLGGIFADFLAAGMLQPELIPVAQTLGSMAGKKLGDMLADYIMSLGLADQEGNPDADKWLAITGQAIDAGKMAYSGYQGLKAVNGYLSGASNAGQAVGAVATAGTGFKDAKILLDKAMKKNALIAKRNDGIVPYHIVESEIEKAYRLAGVPYQPPQHIPTESKLTKVKSTRRSTAQMKKLLKEKLDNYHLVNTLKRGRGRPRGSKNKTY